MGWKYIVETFTDKKEIERFLNSFNGSEIEIVHISTNSFLVPKEEPVIEPNPSLPPRRVISMSLGIVYIVVIKVKQENA